MLPDTMTRLFRERRVTLAQFETASPYFHALLRDISVCAQRRGPVVLTGESGTGKTMLTLALHNASPLREGPFVPVNLGAIKEHLAASGGRVLSGRRTSVTSMPELADGESPGSNAVMLELDA